MASDGAILNAIAAIGRDVAGINDNAIYSLGGGGTVAGVKDLPDDIAMNGFPAFVVMDGGTEIIPGSWERTTWTIEASVWVEYSPRGERVRGLLNLREPIRAAFRAKAKGGNADAAVQSVLITGTGAIETRQWRRVENAPTYLVLPISIEVKVNRAVTYVAA